MSEWPTSSAGPGSAERVARRSATRFCVAHHSSPTPQYTGSDVAGQRAPRNQMPVSNGHASVHHVVHALWGLRRSHSMRIPISGALVVLAYHISSPQQLSLLSEPWRRRALRGARGRPAAHTTLPFLESCFGEHPLANVHWATFLWRVNPYVLAVGHAQHPSQQRTAW